MRAQTRANLCLAVIMTFAILYGALVFSLVQLWSIVDHGFAIGLMAVLGVVVAVSIALFWVLRRSIIKGAQTPTRWTADPCTK